MRLLPRKREDVFPSLFNSNFEMDVFDRFFKEANYPQLDIKDAEDHYEVEVDIPGFAKENISVEYKDGYLQLQGKKEENKETTENDGHYIRKERSYGSFKRSFYIGDVDENHISGSFKDGVLMLQVPKSKEDKQKDEGHQIKIE
ncbi:HSP20 family protein [Planomicrobium stackebrandtii]|uniref:HSP20 family protein n=1 Tax=Planomicrobium stackebrandtii TaxID=253160 RepID=A0ABU0GRI4_9BACL|nr:Hsp20/alpha crystallin family protein [Planomicrobium stackebrandtii]MDQ0427371.1 HSP20 family protein [Planomicrobium stackebrandtii]